jgi:hypothetical protein
MNPEERKMLEEALALSRENNDIIKRMWRSQRVGRAIKVVYWVIIIGGSVGALYLFQPYLDAIKGGATDIRDTRSQYEEIKNLFSL